MAPKKQQPMKKRTIAVKSRGSWKAQPQTKMTKTAIRKNTKTSTSKPWMSSTIQPKKKPTPAAKSPGSRSVLPERKMGKTAIRKSAMTSTSKPRISSSIYPATRLVALAPALPAPQPVQPLQVINNYGDTINAQTVAKDNSRIEKTSHGDTTIISSGPINAQTVTTDNSTTDETSLEDTSGESAPEIE